MSLLIKQEQDIWELWNESQIENQDNLLVPLKIYSSNNNVDILEATNYLLKRMETMYYVETLYEKRFVYKLHPDWLESFILCSPVRFSAAEQSYYTKEAVEINQIIDNEGFYVGDSMSLFLCIKPATEIDSYKIISNFNMSMLSDLNSQQSMLSSDQYSQLKNNFINDVDYEKLCYIIKNKRLPENGKKAIWTAQRVEAARFCAIIGMELKQWNQCFDFFPRGRKLKSNDKPDASQPNTGEINAIFSE